MAQTSFDYFRQNQALMLVIFLMAIIGFVFAEPLLQMAQTPSRGGRGADEVAVSWDGGELTEEQLSSLVGRRQQLMRFLAILQRTGYEAAVAAGEVQPRPLVVPIRLPTTEEEGVEQSVVSYRLYADAARRAGLRVSDQTIRGYLRALGYDRVSPSEMREILRGRSGRGGVNIRYMFDLLREAMLARNFLQSYFYTIRTTLPEQRWRDWLRVKDEVVVEAAALRVEDFLTEAPEPTEEELDVFFEQYRDVVAERDRIDGVELPRPTPAFATPRRVVLQYAGLPFGEEVDRISDTLTEDEVRAFYDQNKDLYVDTGFSEPDDLAGDMLEEAPPLEAPPDDSEAGVDGSGVAPPPDRPADGGGADPPEPTGAPADAAAEPEGPADGGAATTPRGLFRLAAFQAAGDSASPSGEDPTPSEGEGEAAPSRPADSLFDSDDLQEPAAENADPPDQDGPAGISDRPDREEDQAVTYRPFDEVKGDARLRLAERRARLALPDRMREVMGPLIDAYEDYDIAVMEHELREDKAAATRPEPPKKLEDIRAFAEQAGLEFGETEALSLLELRDSPIGRTYDLVNTDGRTRRPLPLWRRVFGRVGLERYEPVAFFDASFAANGSALPLAAWVVVKQQDTPRKTPSLDEVRDEAVLAWRKSRAAELALKRAEEIAAEAEGKGLALQDYLAAEPGIVVRETAPFSWLTTGQFAAAAPRVSLRLSQPQGIESPGPEFMETVFGLGPNELGAVLNQDHTVAYVVRVAQRLASRADLRRDFLLLGETEHRVYGLGERHAVEIEDAILNGLLGVRPGEDPLDWKRLPDAPRDAADGSS